MHARILEQLGRMLACALVSVLFNTVFARANHLQSAALASSSKTNQSSGPYIHNYTKDGMPNFFDPVLFNNDTEQKTWVEGGDGIAVFPHLEISDADNASWPFIAFAEAVVSKNYQWGVDKLSPSLPLSLTSPTSPLKVSWDNPTALLVINGTATIDEYTTFLRGISFRCDSTNPKSGANWDRTVKVRVNDGHHYSTYASLVVKVTSVNNLPQMESYDADKPRLYTGSPMQLLPNLELKDADDPKLYYAEVSTGKTNITGDLLAVDYDTETKFGIKTSWNSETQTMRFSGSVGLQFYQASLNLLLFSNSVDSRSMDFDTTARIAEVKLHDGKGSSTFAVTIQPVRRLTISKQPLRNTTMAPSLTFITDVNVTGTGTITYQWHKFHINGTETTMDFRVVADEPMLSIPGLLYGVDTAVYRCKVSNEAGSVWSDDAELHVWSQFRVPTWYTHDSHRALIYPYVSAQYSDTIVVRWLPPDGNGFGVERYVFEVRTPLSSKWIKAPELVARANGTGTYADPVAMIRDEDFGFKDTNWELKFRVRAYTDERPVGLTGLPSGQLRGIYANAQRPEWKQVESQHVSTYDNILWSSKGPGWSTADGLYWKTSQTFSIQRYKYANAATLDPLDNIYMTVKATATPQPFYIWRRNGIVIEGETTDNLLIMGVQKELHEGKYTVTIGNYMGNATSDVLLLSVSSPPATVAIAQAHADVAAGEKTLLSCSASSSPMPSEYLWYKLDVNGTKAPLPVNDGDFSGNAQTNSDGSELSLVSTLAQDEGQYSCVAVNDACKQLTVQGNGTCISSELLTLKLAPCTEGRYRNPEGYCVKCGRGRYQFRKEHKDTQCLECNRGQFQTKFGQSSCHLCHPGSFAATSGQTLCDDCLPGKFSSIRGANICSACPSSTYTKERKQAACIHCAPGLAQPLSGQTSCKSCEAGNYAPTDGVAACKKCPGGKYAPLPGASQCETCVAGKYQNDLGVTGCKACPTNTYSSVVGSHTLAQCVSCNQSTGTLSPASDAQHMCVCREGFFDLAQLHSTNTAMQRCQSCPEGGDCSYRGILRPTLKTQNGWWRENSAATKMYPCVPSHIDEAGRHHDCVGGVPGDSSLAPTMHQCSNVTEGALCSQCKDGYYRTDGKCEVCPDGDVLGLTVAGIFGLVALISLLVVFFLWPDRHSELARAYTEKQKKHKELDSENDVATGAYTSTGLEVAIAAAVTKARSRYTKRNVQVTTVVGNEPVQGKAKIFISWAQCLGLCLFTFTIPWPREFAVLLKYLYGISTFDFFSMLDSHACHTDTSFLWGYTFDLITLPIMIGVIGFAYWIAFEILVRRRYSRGFTWEKDQRWELMHRIVEGIHEKFCYNVYANANHLKNLIEHSAYLNFRAKHEIKVLEGSDLAELEAIPNQEPPPLFLQDECCRTVQGLLRQAQLAQEAVKEVLQPGYPNEFSWESACSLHPTSFGVVPNGHDGELESPQLPWIDRIFSPGVKGHLWCQHAVDFTLKRQGTYRRVHDACTFIIQAESCYRMMQAKAEIEKLFRVKAVHNRHASPTVMSRSDMLIWAEVDLPDGNTHIVEFQLEHHSFGEARASYAHKEMLERSLLRRCRVQTQDVANVLGFILHTMQDYHLANNPHSFKHSDAFGRQLFTAKLRAKQSALFSLFLVFPGVLQRLALVFRCLKIASKEYLASDLSVVCWEREHTPYTQASAVLLVVFGLGVPTAALAFLRRNRARIVSGDAVFRAQYGSMYAQYKPSHWYFELVVTAKKVLLAAVMAAVSEGHSTQVLAGLLICVAYMLLLVNQQPFLRAYDFRLEQCSAVQTVLVLLAGVMLQLREEEGAVGYGLYSGHWNTILTTLSVLMIVGAFIILLLSIGGEEWLRDRFYRCTDSLSRKIDHYIHRNAVRPMNWAPQDKEESTPRGKPTLNSRALKKGLPNQGRPTSTELVQPTSLKDTRSRSVDFLRADMVADKKDALRAENIRLKAQLMDKSQEHNELIELGELREENKALREENLALTAELTGLKTRKLAGEPSAEAVQALHACPMTLLDLAYRKGLWETEVECDICQKTVFVQRGFPLDYCTECNYCVCNACAKRQIMNYLPPPPELLKRQDQDEQAALALLQPMITVDVEEKARAIQKLNNITTLNEMTLRAKKLEADTPVHQRKKILSELRSAQIAVATPPPLTLKEYHEAIDQSTKELKKELKSQLVSNNYQEELMDL